MACKDHSKRKCFTMIWKLENVNDWWSTHSFKSPVFTVEEIDYIEWKLRLDFNRYRDSHLCLFRKWNGKDVENVILDCELALVSSDGTVLHSVEEKIAGIDRDGLTGPAEFPSWSEAFFARRSIFLSQNALTIRCRLWKSFGEIAISGQCFARTRVAVEKMSFLWDVNNFSTLKSDDKQMYEIKSLRSGQELMTLKLFLPVGLSCEEKIRLNIILTNEYMKAYTRLSIVDASKNTVKCFEEEFCLNNECSSTEFTLFYTRRELLEKKSAYLPSDVLSLLCECSFGFGTSAIESQGFQCAVTESQEPGDHCWDIENVVIVPKRILIDNLKSMLNNNTLTDVKLRTKTKTHPAHKCILSSRSTVFEAMFSNEMGENIVDIEDLSDDTLTRMLQYIYSADVGDLEWVSATALYEAAKKYEILPLKDNCSSYIKTRLCPSNACDALVLADLHEDKDLKTFVQYFILRNGKDIMNSEKWENLMKNNLNLAVETMHLLHKK